MLSISSVMQDVSPLLVFKGKKIPFLQQKNLGTVIWS